MWRKIAYLVLAITVSTVNSASLSSAASPLTGELGDRGASQPRVEGAVRSALAGEATRPIPGALYGTDGDTLYLINKTSGAATPIGPHGPVEFAIGALAFDSAGVLYGISLTAEAKLYAIDPASGAATAIGPLGIGFIFEGGLDFDRSGILFGVNQGDELTAKMFIINKLTGAATVVGPTPGAARDLNGLAFDGGTLYAIDRVSNTLGTVSPATGVYTPIGNVGVTIGATGGLAIDPADRKLYAAFETGGLYTLDKQSGLATLIAITNTRRGLAFAPRGKLCPILFAVRGAPERTAMLETAYRLRDEVLARSPEGRRYIGLFYEHAWESTRLLLRYPRLRAQTRAVLAQTFPVLQAVVDGHPGELTAADVAAIEDLLDALAAKARPDLRRAIEQVHAELRSGALASLFRLSAPIAR